MSRPTREEARQKAIGGLEAIDAFRCQYTHRYEAFVWCKLVELLELMLKSEGRIDDDIE